MTSTTNSTILVIGSTGKTGKRVADQLERLGIPVRHGFRTSDIPFNWEDRQTWAPALEGIGKVYVAYYPDLAVPGSVDAIRALTELATDAGVRHVVHGPWRYLSAHWKPCPVCKPPGVELSAAA